MKPSGRKHYSLEEWVDFATQQASAEQLAAMQRHLQSGCKKCSKVAGLWTRVERVASRQRSVEPPASAVQHVERAFKLLAQPNSGKRRWQVPRIVFDSLWQPALAGVRSGGSAPRHVIYAAGGVNIDMRLEPEPKSERVVLAGQVTVLAGQPKGLPPVPVVVSGSSGQLASVMTNQHGEFHVAFVPEQGLQVSFAMPGKREFVIPLENTRVR